MDSRNLIGEEDRDSRNILENRVLTGHLLDTHSPSNLNESVLHFIHNKSFHYFMAFLLVLDVLIVVANIAVEIEFYHSGKEQCKAYVRETYEPDRPDHSFGNMDYYNAKLATMWGSIGILSTFCLEHFVLICVLQSSYFNLWNVLDLFIIVTSLALELVFPDAEGGLLIVARTWRFARIFHGLIETKNTVHEFEQQLTSKKTDLDTTYNTMQRQINSFCPELSPRDKSALHSLTPAQIRAVARRLADDHPDILVDLVATTGNFLASSRNSCRAQSQSVAAVNVGSVGPSLNGFSRSESRSNLF
jgi:hypothetical protein